jgi:lysophospholipase L1-like esterase
MLTSRARGAKVEPRALSRAFGVLCGIAVVIAIAYVVPSLHALRPWVRGGTYVPFWNIVGRELMGQGKELEAEAARVANLRRQTQPLRFAGLRRQTQAVASHTQRTLSRVEAANPVFPAYAPPAELETPEYGVEPAEALDYYYRKLTLVDLGTPGAIARAGHWGDSVLGVDGITSAIRRRLQARFGDAGHGFHLMDRYNPSYQQQGVEFEAGGGWERCLIVQQCQRQDNRYGYGGLIVFSHGGAASVWRTPKEGFGQTVSAFELWFAHQEGGGELELTIDGARTERVSTHGTHLADGWYRVDLSPGPHSFRVRAQGPGRVRAYGVVLENDGPGVVWDGMALIGGSTRGLRTQDAEHIASQIRRRDLDLLVFLFGGNDMERNWVDLKQSMQPYYDEFSDVLQRFRAGKPELPCLILSVTDHGERTEGDDIVSRPFAKELAAAQREVARQNGCGFFDTYEAMGGEGSVARWFRASPRLISPDLGHPTGAGHEVIGGLVANAILHGYESFRWRMRGQPFPERSAERQAVRRDIPTPFDSAAQDAGSADQRDAGDGAAATLPDG